MIKKSIRIYSVSEIKKMSEEGITEDFQTYISNAQENIKEHLLDSSYGEKIRTCFLDLKEKTEIVSLNVALEDLNNNIIKQENDIVFQNNPYENISFENRIDVKDYVIHLCKEDFCQKHQEKFEIIQVLINYDVGRKYGVMTKCCKKCKKLFMTKAEVNEWKPYLNSKNIEMIISKEN